MKAPREHPRDIAFRPLSIFRKQSVRNRASADKLGDGAGNGLGLLQHQKVCRPRQVDNPDALAELLAERVAIGRWSRCIHSVSSSGSMQQ
jgi:hypothetical protein